MVFVFPPYIRKFFQLQVNSDFTNIKHVECDQNSKYFDGILLFVQIVVQVIFAMLLFFFLFWFNLRNSIIVETWYLHWFQSELGTCPQILTPLLLEY